MHPRPASLLIVTTITALCLFPLQVGAATFTVVSDAGTHDANPGDGFCIAETVGCTGICPAVCTLLAAIEEANAHGQDDTVELLNGIYTVPGKLPALQDDVTIRGAGAWETVLEPLQGVDSRLFDVDLGVVVTLSDLTIRGFISGPSEGLGGAVENEGDLTVERVWFDGNSAQDGCGAISSTRDLEVRDSTFTGNFVFSESDGAGGALCVSAPGLVSGATATVTNSTFVGNRAARGAAISVASGSSGWLNLLASTIVDNAITPPPMGTPSASSAIHHANGFLQIDRTLIVGDCDLLPLDVGSLGGNVESPGSTCVLGLGGDQSGLSRAELHLGDLTDWGGPVPTILPGIRSLAVDPPASSALCPGSDARGEPRFAPCDAGAVERQFDDPESGPLFIDGFESGDVSDWSLAVP